MSRVLTSILLIGLLAGAAPAAISLDWIVSPPSGPGSVGDGSVPAGYSSYLLMCTTDVGIGVVELLAQPDETDVFYMNAYHDYPEDPLDEGSSYVTMGGAGGPPPTMYGSNYANTNTGNEGAVDLPGCPSVTQSFDADLINITWAINSGVGNYTGPGTFQVARVTLKDNQTGTWAAGVFEYGGESGGGSPDALIVGVGPLFIPEPTTMLVLLGGALAGLIRRR